jgi:hypothetical protein
LPFNALKRSGVSEFNHTVVFNSGAIPISGREDFSPLSVISSTDINIVGVDAISTFSFGGVVCTVAIVRGEHAVNIASTIIIKKVFIFTSLIIYKQQILRPFQNIITQLLTDWQIL